MRTLILFSTRYGQTREIAFYLASQLKDRDVYADVVNLKCTEEIAWQEYDRVVIGASIHYGHFHQALNRFVKKHLEWLTVLPGAFYSVNLAARKVEQCTSQNNNYTRRFLLHSPWQPQLCTVFAGALCYPHYRWYDRLMILLIMKILGDEIDIQKKVVYTDWKQVDAFALEIARLVPVYEFKQCKV